MISCLPPTSFLRCNWFDCGLVTGETSVLCIFWSNISQHHVICCGGQLHSWLQPRKLGNHQMRCLCGQWWHPVTLDDSSRESAFCLPYHVSLKNLAEAAVGAGERKHYLTPVSSQISLFLWQQRPFVAVDICHAGLLSFMMTSKLLCSRTVCNLREWPLWQMVALESQRSWRISAVKKPCKVQMETHSSALQVK